MGIPISMLCDRTQVNIAKAQIGFIDVIIKPAFELLSKVLPDITDNLKNCELNRTRWESL